MTQVPAHGGGQVACLGLQPLEPLAVAGAAQGPIGPVGQRPVVLGMAVLDLGDVGPRRKPLGDEGADRVEHPRPRTAVADRRG